MYANKHRKKLLQLPGFARDTIEEAFSVAHRMRMQSGMVQSGYATKERDRWLRVRNGLAMLLSERIAAVRRAARYVLRAHPRLMKEYMSAYEQRKRKGGREE